MTTERTVTDGPPPGPALVALLVPWFGVDSVAKRLMVALAWMFCGCSHGTTTPACLDAWHGS